MDNKVNFLRGTATEYEAKTKDNDTFYYTTDTKKLYLGETEITGIEIDDTSTTATDKTWSAKKISDSIPTELPADGGNADTLAGNSIDKFLKYNGIATDCDECTARGVYQATSSTLNTPNASYLTDRTPILITFDGSFQLFFTGDKLYSRAYCIDPYEIISPHWSDWRIVSNDDNADTVDGLHANEIAYNPNLLDNPDFKINQRGQTDYSASGSSYAFILDRWVISRSVVSVVDDGISAAWNGTDSTGGWIQQHIENAADFAGMTITVSALVDGEVLSGTATVPTAVNSSNSIATSNPSIKFTVGHYSNDRLGVAIILMSTTPCVIGWVKAEIRKNATPFVPPNPAEELAKCQRYYQIRSTNDVDPVDLRPTMRTTPTDIKQVTGGYAYVAEL